MSLRTRIRLIAIVLIALWFLAHLWFVGARSLLEGWELWSLLLAIALGMAISNVVIRRSLTRYKEALAREDIQAAQHEQKLLVDFWKWSRGRETIKTYGINILILQERYKDALEQLQALDMKQIGKKGTPVITTQIAWCLAQLGEPEKAIELLQSSFPQMLIMGPRYASSANLVRGVCEFLMGRPSEAVPYLEQACSSAESGPSRKATAAFYVGESYFAVGSTSEARSAYQKSQMALPTGRFAIRAGERLKQFPLGGETQ
jgi:tetratricopeptide (TPR) repeat protein